MIDRHSGRLRNTSILEILRRRKDFRRRADRHRNFRHAFRRRVLRSRVSLRRVDRPTFRGIGAVGVQTVGVPVVAGVLGADIQAGDVPAADTRVADTGPKVRAGADRWSGGGPYLSVNFIVRRGEPWYLSARPISPHSPSCEHCCG